MQVFAVAALVNLIGDVWLVMGLGWGVVGAAVATVAAQYIGAFFFIWYLRRQGQKPGGVPLAWQVGHFSNLNFFNGGVENFMAT